MKYSKKAFPSTSYILDLIRGSFVFSSPLDLHRGLQSFMNHVQHGDSSFKSIARIKNLFSDINSDDVNDVGKYRDIKVNAVFFSNNLNKSLIVEVCLFVCLIHDKMQKGIRKINLTDTSPKIKAAGWYL